MTGGFTQSQIKMNTSEKALQALNLLKGIAEDAPIKLVEHQLAEQSINVIFDALHELHNLRSNNDPKKKKEQIFTNMLKEELEIIFPSGNYIIPHSGFDRCCLNKTVSQSIQPGLEWQNITWNSNRYDNNEIHSVVLNNERITIKRAGMYIFLYKVNTKRHCNLRLYKNGTEIIPHSLLSTSYNNSPAAIPFINLKAGDYIVLQANHYDDLAKDILPENSFLACERRY